METQWREIKSGLLSTGEDKNGSLDRALNDQNETEIGRRQIVQSKKSKREMDSRRLKTCRMEADCIREGGIANDWTRAMMSGQHGKVKVM